ncbi:MAG: hypothetical protein H6669_01620 [Ardenticatenaceae bacterium]|nr:hypothetical protein [Ardenticatenaceae bacterium]
MPFAVTVLQQFIIAARRAMENVSIDAPLMVARRRHADERRICRLHTGGNDPFRSGANGAGVSPPGWDKALVVDVGDDDRHRPHRNAQVTVSEEGATVGGHKRPLAANLPSIVWRGHTHPPDQRAGADHLARSASCLLAYLGRKENSPVFTSKF